MNIRHRLVTDDQYKRSLLKAYKMYFHNRVTEDSAFRNIDEWNFDLMVENHANLVYDWIASLRVFGEDVVLPQLHYPSTWWQHFKMRWYPKLLLKWFPVRYNCYVVEGRALYPNLSAPRHMPYVEVLSTKHIIWGQDDD